MYPSQWRGHVLERYLVMISFPSVELFILIFCTALQKRGRKASSQASI